jgi:ankyrin repeat protein
MFLPQAGNTTLHLAASGGHVLVVLELLRAGADASLKNEVAAHSFGAAVCLLLQPLLSLCLCAVSVWLLSCQDG